MGYHRAGKMNGGIQMSIPALSIRAPWWWFILHAGKDIENRDWRTSYRGTIYVHASKWWDEDAICMDAAAMIMVSETVESSGIDWKTVARMEMLGGHIVGQVDIVDCVFQSESPWFFGEFGFVLANPLAYAEPVPCKGAQRFFNPLTTTPGITLPQVAMPV